MKIQIKSATLTLIAASSLGLPPSANAGDTVLLPAQQNNCANTQVTKQISAENKQQLRRANTPELKAKNKKEAANKEHPIDLVICLDTSSSMNGLIDSAKQKIWDIVNELALAKPRPYLRVGLYAYGSPSFGAESGFVHKVLDLTDDLDEVFKQLTALRTYGGEEYCARVISTATKEQPWSKNKKALKIIVDAGNEPATLDPTLNVFDTAKEAISKGIIVNTIFCGSPSHRDAADWRKIASLADGQFAAIDQNRGTVAISTPYDQKLSELNSKINSTYLAYGQYGHYGKQKQVAADSLSRQLGASNFASRAAAKISGQYRNSSWDLVDASKKSGFALSQYRKAELPAAMQTMNTKEQQAYLDSKVKERSEIQKQIAEINTQRSVYIQNEIRKSGKSTDNGFDTAMMKALREQAKRNGFSFEAK